jgi:predicted AlkP superfamily phosphohydrolase/phosphomutase
VGDLGGATLGAGTRGSEHRFDRNGPMGGLVTRSTRVRTLVALAAALLAAGMITRSRRPIPTVRRLVLLGLDGASPNLLEPLVEQGKLPAFQRLMREGSYGPLQSFRPGKSGVIWTSIATGKTMLKHGILDWTFVNDEGLTVPYQDSGRRVKTYWEILAERGFSTGTINWWVTHPPRAVPNGYVVGSLFCRRKQPDTVSPSRLFDWLNALRLRRPDVALEMHGRGVPERRLEDATVPMTRGRRILYSYRSYFAQDVTIDRVSDYLWVQQPVQVFSTYFRLIDVTSHFAGHFVDRKTYDEVAALFESERATADDIARLDREMARVTAPAYQFMDRIVAKYLDRIDEHTALIVCSDHGFRFMGRGYDHYGMPDTPDGVIFLAGPGARRGFRFTGATVYDIAPTILHWLGQPVAEDMDGRVLREPLSDFISGHPVRTVATFENGVRAGSSSADPTVSEDVLEDLRTLGYIDDEAETEPAAPTPMPSVSPDSGG